MRGLRWMRSLARRPDFMRLAIAIGFAAFCSIGLAAPLLRAQDAAADWPMHNRDPGRHAVTPPLPTSTPETSTGSGRCGPIVSSQATFASQPPEGPPKSYRWLSMAPCTSPRKHAWSHWRPRPEKKSGATTLKVEERHLAAYRSGPVTQRIPRVFS